MLSLISDEVITWDYNPGVVGVIDAELSELWGYKVIHCELGQNDTIGKIELNPSFVLSSNRTNCKNDIQ